MATIWKWVMLENAKPHLVCTTLERPLIAEMTRRECKLQSSKIVRRFGLDMPGMIHTQRPWEKFWIPGLSFEIPSEDVHTFRRELEELPERFFGKRSYYKLHAHFRAWVLTPAQRVRLILLLRGREDGAEARAKKFYDGIKPASAVLREAAARVSGTPLAKIPDLGGHKVDRFITNPKGAEEHEVQKRPGEGARAPGDPDGIELAGGERPERDG